MVLRNAVFEAAYEATEPNRRRPVDLVHLAKQSFGDPGLEEEILRVFAGLLRAQFGRVETSTNVEDLGANVHALHLAAGGVGAWGLARQAGFIEEQLAAGVPVDPEWIDDLEMVVQEVAAYVDSLIPADAA